MLTVTALVACGSTQNHEERQRYAERNGLIAPDTCIATCLENSAPERVDCGAPVQGYEFFPAIDITDIVTVYQYDDKTVSAGAGKDTLFEGEGESGFGDDNRGYEPRSVAMPRCRGDDDDDPNRVMLLRGGPYLYYGAGAGRALHQIPPTADLPISTEYGVWARDVSEWEGVSFWARRGIESQAGFRVAIGDKYVDEDLAYVEYYTRVIDMPESDIYPRPKQAYCRRARECDCPLGKPCTFYEGSATGANSGYYCWDPEVDLEPLSEIDVGMELPLGTRVSTTSQGVATVNHDRCRETQCNRFYPAYEGEVEFTPPADYCPRGVDCDEERPFELGQAGFDPEFYGRECTRHTFTSGHTGDYCFDPGTDPPPPENDEWCTDNRFVPVYLTTEWEFYTVPFAEMLQYGYAKESFDLDLHNVATLRFTWDRGWAEFWVDDVSFYRRAER